MKAKKPASRKPLPVIPWKDVDKFLEPCGNEQSLRKRWPKGIPITLPAYNRIANGWGCCYIRNLIIKIVTHNHDLLEEIAVNLDGRDVFVAYPSLWRFTAESKYLKVKSESLANLLETLKGLSYLTYNHENNRELVRLFILAKYEGDEELRSLWIKHFLNKCFEMNLINRPEWAIGTLKKLYKIKRKWS